MNWKILLLMVGLIVPHTPRAQDIDQQVATLYKQGRYEEAIPWAEQAVKAARQKFGTEHPNYASSINNLASLYRAIGEYIEAEPLFQQALEIIKGQLGEDHPEYSRLLFNLASLYEAMGRYTEAESLYLKTNKIIKEQLYGDHPQYASSLNNLGWLYQSMERYQEAEPLMHQALEVTKEQLGEDHPQYAILLHNLAGIYKNMSRYQEAEPLYLQALEIYKDNGIDFSEHTTWLKLAELYEIMERYQEAEPLMYQALEVTKEQLGVDHPQYASVLYNLAGIYKNMGRYQEAEPLYLKAIKIYKGNIKDNQPEYFIPEYMVSLLALTRMYESMSRYQEAESFLLQYLEMYKENIGEDHPDYVTFLLYLARLYKTMDLYAKAEPYYLQSLMITKEQLGEDDPEYTTLLINLARLYETMGRYTEAESRVQQALEITKEQEGKDYTDYGGMINFLARLHINMGRYAEAESQVQQALKITKKHEGESNPIYASLLNTLAQLYKRMGRYVEAEPLYQKALEITKKQLGEDHPNFPTILNNLALLSQAMGEYTEAEPLYQKALEITKKHLGEDHSLYGNLLNNLGWMYQYMGQYADAKLLFQEAIEIIKEQLGEDHPNYSFLLSNLGVTYQAIGEYGNAKLLFQEAIEIIKEQLGEDHPDYATILNNLASLYHAMGKFTEAEKLLRQANDIIIANLEQNFGGLSEKEKQQNLQTVKNTFEAYHSLVLNQKSVNPFIATLSYNNSLVNKGLLLASSQEIRRAILNSQDPQLLATYQMWIELKQQLAALYSKPINDRYSNTDSLEQLANTLERELGAGSVEFQTQQQVFQVRWQDVQDSLHEREAAIEFVHFAYYNQGIWTTDTTYYAALLLRPGDAYPQMVQLCTQTQLDSLLSGKNNETLADVLYIDYANDSSQMLRDLSGEAHQLYRLIWQPLDSLLSGVERIYYAPSGRLHQINLDAVLHPEGDRLMDRYALVRLSSTRSLALPDNPNPSLAQASPSAALFGGIRYGSDSASSPEQSSPAYPNQVAARPTTHSLTDLSYLPATEKEVADIKYYLQPPQWDTHVYSDYQATEQQFNQLGALDKQPSPTIIHLATHGFFFENVVDTTQRNTTRLMDDHLPAYRLSEEPLLRAGLMLSYAQRAWKGDSILEWQKEDGILTAYEIAQQDLSHTELVVLSACETGLGDIRGSEGVYGLQRAFKMAGVDYLMMSLWKVPDAPTRQMMNYFYYSLIEEQMSVRKAFRAAQQQMIEDNYPPFAWAAFVLLQ